MRRGWCPMMSCRVPLHPLWNMLIFMLHMNNPSSSTSYLWIDIVLSVDGIYMLANVIIIDPIWINLVSHTTLFWRAGRNAGDSSKRKILLKSVPYKLIFPSCHWSLWVFASTSWQFFSSLDGMGCKGLQKHSSFNFVYVLQAEGINGIATCTDYMYFKVNHYC
jgi:hypothetical protein